MAAGAVETAVSLALNLAVMAGLVQLAFPRVLDKREPHTITVDLVPEPPKPATPSGGPSPAPTSQGHAGGPAADPAKAHAAEPAPSSPAADLKPAESKPDKPAPDDVNPAMAENPPAAPAAEPEAKPVIEPPTPDAAGKPATPASIDGGHDPAPRLVAAPAAPGPAETQAEKNVLANTETKTADAPKPTEQTPAPAQPTLASPAATADEVPPPSSAAETPRPAPTPSADEKRQADNTAKLAAALPFAQNLPPTFARSALAGMEGEAVQHYRGEVYGQFRKADDLVDQARAAHLRGQTVVEFSIDDSGALTGLRVAVSSGDAAVDRTAEDIIRRSAPFPPPPPGAQHVFSPAIRLGLDE